MSERLSTRPAAGPFGRARRVVALAAQASELLAEAAGALHQLARAHVPVDAVLATDGAVNVGDPMAPFVRLGLTGVAVHRLGLERRFPMTAEDDVLAALSEVIGFDPGPGLMVLAPAPLAGRADRAVLSRAARLAAGIYGAALVRCLPPDDPTRPWAVRLPLPADVAAGKWRHAPGVASAPERFLVDHTVTLARPRPPRSR
jgi:hypothetical protein